MALSDVQLLDFLSRMPFIDTAELAGILGESPATIHRALSGQQADGIVGRVSHGTTHLPSSQRYYLTANGIGEAARILGFDAPSDFVHAYPESREWLALLIRRMDAVATIYRLAASLSPEPTRLGRRWNSTAGAASTPRSPFTTAAASAWCARELALRRRSLYDRLRAIAEYDYTRRPEATLILTPSVWEQRLTARFCMELNLGDCYVAAESRDALERRDLRLWCHPSFVFGSSYHTLETAPTVSGFLTESSCHDADAFP